MQYLLIFEFKQHESKPTGQTMTKMPYCVCILYPFFLNTNVQFKWHWRKRMATDFGMRFSFFVLSSLCRFFRLSKFSNRTMPFSCSERMNQCLMERFVFASRFGTFLSNFGILLFCFSFCKWQILTFPSYLIIIFGMRCTKMYVS